MMHRHQRELAFSLTHYSLRRGPCQTLRLAVARHSNKLSACRDQLRIYSGRRVYSALRPSLPEDMSVESDDDSASSFLGEELNGDAYIRFDGSQKDMSDNEGGNEEESLHRHEVIVVK